MKPKLSKLSLITLFLLVSGLLSLAASKNPDVCVPNDTKCLHPEQPLAVAMFSGGIGAILADDDETRTYMNRDYDDTNDLQDRVNNDRERAREWREEREDNHLYEHHSPDIDVDTGR